jgi:hypothetical protein
MAMFEIDAQRAEAFEFTRGVVGSVIACFVLLVCLVIADQLFWTDRAATNQSQYEHHPGTRAGEPRACLFY